MATLAFYVGAIVPLMLVSIACLGALKAVKYQAAGRRQLAVLLGAIVTWTLASFGMADGGPVNWTGAFESYAPPALLLLALSFLGERRDVSTNTPSSPPAATKIDNLDSPQTADSPNSAAPFSATPTAPSSARIHWRNGLRRIFVVLSFIYFGLWGVGGWNFLHDNPFVLGELPLPATKPTRALEPTENENPRVQLLLDTLAQHSDGGVTYSDPILDWYSRSQERKTGASEFPPRGYSLQNVQASIEATNRLGKRTIVLPGANGNSLEIDGSYGILSVKQVLDAEYNNWRWPVRIFGKAACLDNGQFDCGSSYGQDVPMPVDLSIHCRANLIDSYLSQTELLDLIPRSCGELGMQLHDRAIKAKEQVQRDWFNGWITMIAIWLGVLALGKAFWWIVSGFTRQTDSASDGT